MAKSKKPIVQGIKERLENNKSFQEFENSFRTSSWGGTKVPSEYSQYIESGTDIELKKGSALAQQIKEIEEAAKQHKRKEGKSGTTPSDLTKSKNALARQGIKGQVYADKLETHFEKLEEAAEKARTAAEDAESKKFEAIRKKYDAGKGKLTEGAYNKAEEKYNKRMDQLGEEYDGQMSRIEGARKVLNEQREKVQELTGVAGKEKSVSKTVSEIGKTGAKAVEGGKPLLGKTVQEAEQVWQKKTMLPKLGTAISANFKGRGALGKILSVGGAGVGAIVVFTGLKDFARFVGMSEPKKDAEGKEIPVGGGTLVKSIAEIGGGTAVALLSLAKGGGHRAMGHKL